MKAAQPGTDAYDAYLKSLAEHHAVIGAAMKAKQTVDPKAAVALRKAIESYPEDKKVVVFGTGGMSHQLQGERAGHINVEFDLQCMESIIDDPEWLVGLGNTEIIEKAGTEGIEVIMWLVMRGALQEKVNVVHKHYHVPVSNTGAGVLVLENPD